MSAAATRTGAQAIAWAKAQSTKPSRSWHNLCQLFVRSCFGVAAKYGSARLAWQGAKRRHETTDAASIPAGVPVFWRTGTVNWHVAISAGDGYCWSSDIGGKGKVGKIGIAALSRAWDATLLGWSEDVNGVRVYTAPTASSSSVTLADLKYGKRNSASVKRLQRALNAHKMPGGNNLPATGNYLGQTDAEVRLCQKLHGYGSDAKGRSFVGPRQAKHLGLTAK